MWLLLRLTKHALTCVLLYASCSQVERAVLDLCLDPSDSYLAAVAVDISSIENNVSSSVRLYEVGRQRPAAGDDDDDSDGAADEVGDI
jgi:hypothetical protein